MFRHTRGMGEDTGYPCSSWLTNHLKSSVRLTEPRADSRLWWYRPFQRVPDLQMVPTLGPGTNPSGRYLHWHISCDKSHIPMAIYWVHYQPILDRIKSLLTKKIPRIPKCMVLMPPLLYHLLFWYWSRQANIVTEHQKRRLCTADSNLRGDQGPVQDKLPSPV